MIPFARLDGGGDSLLTRVQFVIQRGFALAQSAQDLAAAIRGVFTPTQEGTQVVTLAATAPSSIQGPSATRWLTIIEPDGRPTIIAGWR